MLLLSCWTITSFVLIGFDPNLVKDSKPISKMNLKSSENKRKRKFLLLLPFPSLLARRPQLGPPSPFLLPQAQLTGRPSKPVRALLSLGLLTP